MGLYLIMGLFILGLHNTLQDNSDNGRDNYRRNTIKLETCTFWQHIDAI